MSQVPADFPGKSYSHSVEEWGSHPDAGNDDCQTGADFASEAEARQAYDAVCKDRSTAYIVLSRIVGVEMWHGQQHFVLERVCMRKNPAFREETQAEKDAEARAWQREIAQEAGMCMGIDAYNDVMGY